MLDNLGKQPRLVIGKNGVVVQVALTSVGSLYQSYGHHHEFTFFQICFAQHRIQMRKRVDVSRGNKDSARPRAQCLQPGPTGAGDIIAVFVGGRFLRAFSLYLVKVEHHVGVSA